MPKLSVQSFGKLSQSADQAWSILRNFHATWHPAIATMDAELDAAGRSIRTFTVHGEETLYREGLTWFSDSDRSLSYRHIEGIAGVAEYNARLSVSADTKNSCNVTLSARIDAPEPRLGEIATGTQGIFDQAISAIKKLMDSPQSTAPTESASESESDLASTVRAATGDAKQQTRIIDGAPRLAVSCVDGPGECVDTLCLFLHGIGGNRQNWTRQLEAVAPYCRAAALDLRGYGDSELGANQSTVDDYCEDIVRVADALGAKKLILCGLSYGAWIATSFAIRQPERLTALVLSGGCTGMSEAKETEREAFRRSREVPLSQGQTPADFAADVVAVIAGPEITDAGRNELLASMQAIPAKTYADALRCFTNPGETFDFSAINLPVLLMTGEADRLAPPQQIKQVATRIFKSAAFPDVRYECLKGAGHVCNLESPADYNKTLLELLQRVL